MSDCWPRIVDHELDELAAGLPALCVEGPRGVGKTTAALQRASTCFELDDPTVLSVAQADPRRIVEAPGTVVVDEWQRLPAVWDLVRRAVDRDPRPGRFLLTGSALPLTAPTHTGAGRVVAVEVKLAQTVHDRDLRHLHWLADEIGYELADSVVLTTGSEAYRRTDGIAVVPLALLGP